MPAVGEGHYDVTHFPRSIREAYHDQQREITYDIVRPVAEACCGEDDLRPDIELRDALAETRRINRLDGRDVDHLIHEIDH